MCEENYRLPSTVLDLEVDSSKKRLRYGGKFFTTLDEMGAQEIYGKMEEFLGNCGIVIISDIYPKPDKDYFKEILTTLILYCGINNYTKILYTTIRSQIMEFNCLVDLGFQEIANFRSVRTGNYNMVWMLDIQTFVNDHDKNLSKTS